VLGGRADLTVRKFTHRYSLDELVAVGTLSGPVAAELVSGVRVRKKHPDFWRTGTGKTTLLMRWRPRFRRTIGLS